jgi:glycosyltransferase involved in cell wall biosynthesis
MRILFANHTNTISGAGISLSLLLKSLPPEVEKFFCLHWRSELAERFGADPERIHRDYFLSMMHTTRYGTGLSNSLQLFHLLKSKAALPSIALLKWNWKPDLVHLNETTLVPYALAADKLGIPVLVHARTVVNSESRGMQLLERHAMRDRIKFVCIDPETKFSLPENCRKASEVVYNPVSLREVSLGERMQKRAEWKIPAGAIVVGQMASLHKEKGVWRILEIASEICKSQPNIHFVLAGDTSPQAGLGPELESAIQKAGLGKNVRLVGYEKDVALAYAAFDIALCLFGEFLGAVGRAGYEAPLSGKPLVATIPNPLQSDAVISGKTGLAFEPNDYRGVSNAIVSLSKDVGQRESLGISAKRYIGDRHDPKKHAEKIFQIYRSMMNKKNEFSL